MCVHAHVHTDVCVCYRTRVEVSGQLAEAMSEGLIPTESLTWVEKLSAGKLTEQPGELLTWSSTHRNPLVSTAFGRQGI